MLFLFQDRCQSYRQPASTSTCLPHTNSLRSCTHGRGYKYCKYCMEEATNIANIAATGSFANILLCQILFQSGVPNCVTSKQASESFGIIALASVASIVQVLKYQQYSNNTHVTCVPLEILQI